MFITKIFGDLTSAIKFTFITITILLFLSICKLFMFYKEKQKLRHIYDIYETIKKNDYKLFYEKFKKALQIHPDLINKPFDKNGNSLFLKTCALNATKIVEEMINNGADLSYVNNEGNGPFYMSIYHLVMNPNKKDASCIRLLFYAGCNINEKNRKGFTPIHLAAYFGHIPLIKWLLWKGADPLIEPFPAGLALANGYENAASLLLKEPRKTIL